MKNIAKKIRLFVIDIEKHRPVIFSSVNEKLSDGCRELIAIENQYLDGYRHEKTMEEFL